MYHLLVVVGSYYSACYTLIAIYESYFLSQICDIQYLAFTSGSTGMNPLIN